MRRWTLPLGQGRMLVAEVVEVTYGSSVGQPGEIASMRLHDERELAYRQLGDVGGLPVLLFHGFPGSSGDFLPWHEGLLAHGLRGIAVDRPGQGRSARLPGRRLVDWPGDVVELLDHLQVGVCAVLGVSGGGPHALVCAAMRDDRFRRCVLLNTGAPVDTPAHGTGMATGNRMAYLVARRARALVHLQVRLQDQLVRRFPGAVLRALRRSVGPEDAAVVDTMSAEEVLAGLRAATERGTGGVVDEFVLHAQPWGFDLGAVDTEVVAWHGDRDRLAPLEATRWLVGQLPGGSLHELPGRGHLLDAHPEVLNRVLADLGS